MKRLIDTPASDRLSERAHVLLRTLEPTLESEQRLQRVRRSLDARTPAAPRWVVRGALVAALVGASAIAAAQAGMISAVLGGGPAPSAPPRSFGPAPALPPAPAAQARISPQASPSPAAVAPPTLPSGARAIATSSRSDVTRVHDAAKALRRDGDAARALQILERAGGPIGGPLAEEALALRIEASVASGDGRQRKLAAAYLAKYPQGRYRELAKKALGERAP